MNREHLFAQALLRLWPFPRGTGRIVDRFFSKLKFDSELATVRTTDGVSLNVFPNELIGRHIYLTGEFDRSTVEVLLRYSRPGDVLLDIGANLGYVSASFLQNVPQSVAIAVEPQPKTADLLESNLKSFGEHRYKVFPVALSNADGSGWLQVWDSNQGGSRLVDEANKRTIAVKLWSAKTLFAACQCQKIDLVKIDVEGHEATVMEGCEAELSRFRPRAILFEDHSQSAAPDGSIGMILGRIEYQVFGVRKRLTRLEFVPILTRGDCKYVDYLALRRT